jgi:hypothetical protein
MAMSRGIEDLSLGLLAEVGARGGMGENSTVSSRESEVMEHDHDASMDESCSIVSGSATAPRASPFASLQAGPVRFLRTEQQGAMRCAECAATAEKLSALQNKVVALTSARDDMRRELDSLQRLYRQRDQEATKFQRDLTLLRLCSPPPRPPPAAPATFGWNERPQAPGPFAPGGAAHLCPSEPARNGRGDGGRGKAGCSVWARREAQRSWCGGNQADGPACRPTATARVARFHARAKRALVADRGWC